MVVNSADDDRRAMMGVQAPDEEVATMDVGRQLPWLDDVADDRGRSLNWRDARRTRVVFFAHPDACPDCARHVRGLLDRRDSLSRADADVWVISGGAGDTHPVGADGVHTVTGAAADRLRRRCDLPTDEAWLIVADRWGQVWQAEAADDNHALVDPADAVETATFIGVQCPECETLDQPTVDWSHVH